MSTSPATFSYTLHKQGLESNRTWKARERSEKEQRKGVLTGGVRGHR